MTEEKENREYYQAAYRKVHASEHLLRKVEAMGKEREQKSGKRILRRSCVAAAALAFGLISSNMISYAATGSAWIITVTTSDGRILPAEPGTYELGNGMVYTVKYRLDAEDQEYEEDTAGKETAAVKGAEAESTGISSEDLGDRTEAQVVKEGEHVFLDINGVCRIDVTEAFAKGSSEGTFEFNGTKYQYLLTGSPEDDTIIVNAVK